MDRATYRTGQAAHILNVSSHQVRRLCEAGMIEAELTAGKRWRIPAGEVDRLKRDGVPPIPQVEPRPASARASAAAPRYDTPDGDQTKEYSEHGLTPEVQAEADGLAVAERRLKRRKLELEQEDVEDSFREREKRRLAEREAEQRAEEENE